MNALILIIHTFFKATKSIMFGSWLSTKLTLSFARMSQSIVICVKSKYCSKSS